MFNNKKHVQLYVDQIEDYDNSYITELFKEHVKNGTDVLEFGCGIGKDYESFKNDYNIDVSEYSNVLRSEFLKRHGFEPMNLDIRNSNIDKKYDAIYTAKVLPYVRQAEITDVLNDQLKILKPGGILFHTFWYGDNEEEIEYETDGESVRGTVSYFNIDMLTNTFGNDFDLKFIKYNEIGFEDVEFDSIIMIAVKK